jgi:hypothetical protein
VLCAVPSDDRPDDFASQPLDLRKVLLDQRSRLGLGEFQVTFMLPYLQRCESPSCLRHRLLHQAASPALAGANSGSAEWPRGMHATIVSRSPAKCDGGIWPSLTATLPTARTAKGLGLMILHALLRRAREVIEREWPLRRLTGLRSDGGAADFRFWHICDMLSLSHLVRNTLQSGHVRLRISQGEGG